MGTLLTLAHLLRKKAGNKGKGIENLLNVMIHHPTLQQ